MRLQRALWLPLLSLALGVLLSAESTETAEETSATREDRLAHAAAAGDGEAALELVHMLQTRAAVIAEDDAEEAASLQNEALRLLRVQAEAGHAKAMNNLGVVHKDGLHGAAHSDELAVKWFAGAAEQGLAVAEFNVAVMLLAGRGCDKDERLAAAMLIQAADRGDEDAMLRLAKLYADGVGVARDDEAAMAWLKRAASRGHPRARELVSDEL